MNALVPDTALRRAIVALADDGAELWHHTIAPWQSITFSGERHRLRLKLKDQDQVDMVVGRIDDGRLLIPGKLLADASVVELRSERGQAWLTLDLLLLFEKGAT